MSLNKCFSLMVCVSIASLFIEPSTISVAAASNHHPHRVHTTDRPAYGYFGTPPYGYVPLGQYVPGVSDRLIHGPGYVFVPGHGILDEDCNMPTSTCPNEYRNVR